MLSTSKENKVKVKKKKVKTKKFVGKGLKIVDEDSFSLGKPPSESDDEEAEDLPQIAAVVDERPIEVQVLESFSQSKWKRLEEDQGKKPELSPLRNSSKDDISPPRRRVRNNSDDISPPRQRRKRDSDDMSPPRRRTVRNSKSPSPPRRRRRNSSGDISPPRGRNARSSRSASPPRRRQRNSSGDISPPRQNKRRHPSNDASPPRRREQQKRNRDHSLSPMLRGKHRDRDSSPPRRGRHIPSPPRQRRNSRDASPPRRRNISPSRPKDGRRRERERNLARPEILDTSDNEGKRTTTLDGKKAGLQKASALRGEMLDFRQRENELFETLPDEVSGRHAKTVVRDRRTEADIAKEEEKQRKEEARKEQYNKWGKGLKQVEEQNAAVRSALHEMAKPLARYKDDEDLDDHLKKIDREGDPMLEYLTAKRRKATGGVEKPRYNGPPPPPNRFNIPPGYRWDGVDRSNGYEKEWFTRINAKKALQEEAYKWSVEDL